MSSGVAPRRVIILGHTGFIGRALQAHFEHSDLEVHGFSSATLDLRQAAALARLDGYIDPASCLIVTSASSPGSAMTPAALADNVAMIANLATHLETHPVQTCVYLSSDAVYPMLDEAVTETTATDFSSLYALSKLAAERLLEHATRKSGAALTVLRPTAVYGPGDTHNGYGPNRFARSIASERAVRLFGQGEETRDHLYIDDLVQAVARLSLEGQSGVFNIATGSSHSFLAVAELLRESAPYAVEIVTSPRQSAVTHRRFDVSHLRAALPAFEFTPLGVGLAATLAAATQAAGVRS
ncbi:MAG: NAD(P)-dependent oxidoreductase [Chloroflexota bacterium]|nr:NAD(P)-dependent oxidoreductase [Chloroflexota bacterium]